MKLTRDNPLWVAIPFFLTLGPAFRYAKPEPARAAAQPKQRAPLVPKAGLKSEQGSWMASPAPTLPFRLSGDPGMVHNVFDENGKYQFTLLKENQS